MKLTPGQINYTQAGIAAFLPGMRRMVELMQQAVEDLEAQLEAIAQPPPARREIPGIQSRSGLARGTPEYRAVDRHNKRVRAAAARSPGRRISGWPEDPEERSKEMKRRQTVAKLNRTSGKMSTAAKSRWENKSPAKRKKWLQAMQAGKLKAQAQRLNQPVNGAA